MSPDRVRGTRPQRGKSLTARPPARRPRRVIYVVAEGEVTEYDYCTALSNTFAELLGFRIDTPALHIRRNGLKPLEVANHALTVAASTGNDQGGSASSSASAISEIWALFDRDQHHGIPEAFDKLTGHERIRIAFSHPSFDLWLLLHFAQYPIRKTDRVSRCMPGSGSAGALLASVHTTSGSIEPVRPS